MNRIDRIEFALEHVTDKSVMTIESVDWRNLVTSDGAPTEIIETSPPLTALMSMATRVITAGSGIFNPDPGIDVVRYDRKDAPYIYNIDHYTVIENFPNHPQYQRALAVAGVEDSQELRQALLEHVFVVGPYQLDHHWVEEIPEQIKNAKRKT